MMFKLHFLNDNFKQLAYWDLLLWVNNNVHLFKNKGQSNRFKIHGNHAAVDKKV